MPDLTAPAVSDWLRERGPDVVTLPIAGPVDAEPAALQQMVRLGHVLDGALAADPSALSVKLRRDQVLDHLRVALSQAGPGRSVRTMAWLMDAGLPHRQTLLAGLTSESPEGEYLRHLLEALHRRDLLTRIFAPVRIEALLAVCRQQAAGGEA